jgi:hypothetical protein
MAVLLLLVHCRPDFTLVIIDRRAIPTAEHFVFILNGKFKLNLGGASFGEDTYNLGPIVWMNVWFYLTLKGSEIAI